MLLSDGVDTLISIHSLRMEGDVISKLLPPEVAHFNPLPPHGGRLRHLWRLI